MDVSKAATDRRTVSQPRAWREAVWATALAVATTALIWLVAVPWGPIVCPAVSPMPTNCDSSYRMGTSGGVTGIIVVVYLITVLVALSEHTRLRAVMVTGITILAILLFTSYFIVAWSPGFVIGAP